MNKILKSTHETHFDIAKNTSLFKGSDVKQHFSVRNKTSTQHLHLKNCFNAKISLVYLKMKIKKEGRKNEEPCL